MYWDHKLVYDTKNLHDLYVSVSWSEEDHGWLLAQFTYDGLSELIKITGERTGHRMATDWPLGLPQAE